MPELWFLRSRRKRGILSGVINGSDRDGENFNRHLLVVQKVYVGISFNTNVLLGFLVKKTHNLYFLYIER